MWSTGIIGEEVGLAEEGSAYRAGRGLALGVLADAVETTQMVNGPIWGMGSVVPKRVATLSDEGTLDVLQADGTTSMRGKTLD